MKKSVNFYRPQRLAPEFPPELAGARVNGAEGLSNVFQFGGLAAAPRRSDKPKRRFDLNFRRHQTSAARRDDDRAEMHRRLERVLPLDGRAIFRFYSEISTENARRKRARREPSAGKSIAVCFARHARRRLLRRLGYAEHSAIRKRCWRIK